jgi:5'-methylthioadenosine phosphorylase
VRIAIIGGTGMGNWAGEDATVSTPFGPVLLQRKGDVFFLSRHGKGHKLPPHRINYRANIWALKEVGVEAALATFAVGSLTESIGVGMLLIPDNFLDFTTQRPKTIFEEQVVHTDMTHPYSPRLRKVLLEAGDALGLRLVDGGCYVCTDGPRYETPAEVRMFAALGGHVVGMTGLPEVVLARELGIDYGAVAMVTNLAAGLGSGPLSHAEVADQVGQMQEAVQRLLDESLKKLRFQDNQ